MARLLALCLAALTLLQGAAASAHKPSDSYLSLAVAGHEVSGRWDIALRDLEHAIGLDRDGDGAITWGEVKARHPEIAAYALARLELGSAGAACATAPGAQLIDEHSDGAYAVLRFVGDCPAAIGTLSITYRLLFDLDPLHRGLVQVEAGGQVQTSVLGPERPTWQVRLDRPDRAAQLASFLREGIWHIWLGLDHVLFLLCLLLPATRRRPAPAAPGRRAAPVLIEVLAVVTAFTLAHSLTLALAALGIVEVPARLVESAIAASILLAALNNLYPLVTRRLWLVAFGFGLIHGFGFASALAGLALPRDALLLALVSFNLGVELGQLALLAPFFMTLWSLRRLDLAWPRWATPLPACAIAALAALWLVERAFGIALAG